MTHSLIHPLLHQSNVYEQYIFSKEDKKSVSGVKAKA